MTAEVKRFYLAFCDECDWAGSTCPTETDADQEAGDHDEAEHARRLHLV